MWYMLLKSQEPAVDKGPDGAASRISSATLRDPSASADNSLRDRSATPAPHRIIYCYQYDALALRSVAMKKTTIFAQNSDFCVDSVRD